MKRRVALITGASKGIGQEIAIAFAKSDYDVLLAYHQDKQGALQTQKSCLMYGVNAHIFSCDVSKHDETKALVQSCLQVSSSIDVLVSNAGIIKDNLLLMMSESDFDQVINVNLKGLFNISKHVSKVMAKQKSGCILFIGSSSSATGNIGQSNYVASKAGGVAFVKSVALELAKFNIRCNIISPGLIDTFMTSTLNKHQQTQLLDKSIFKKMGTCDDIAQCALFLASDQARYITGQQFFIDGGMVMGG